MALKIKLGAARANQKQSLSNLNALEYSTGRCWSECEQCFVNWGQHGFTVSPLICTTPGWLAAATRYGREHAVGIFKPYTPPPPVERDGGGLPPGHEWLLAKLTPGGKGCWNIPKAKLTVPRKTPVSIVGHQFVQFLRVSSMSDASYAPTHWLREVREAWGSQAFFNTAIKSLLRAHRKVPGLLDEFHSLIVTVNPGFQRVPPYARAVSRPLPTAETSLPWARAGHSTSLDIPFSMGAPRDVDGDFLHPLTLEEVGLGPVESVLRWYRFRALPTIAGLLETDRPVVVTQMRFTSPVAVAEFARRYGLGFEFRIKASPRPDVLEGIARCGFDVRPGGGFLVRAGKNEPEECRLWSRKDDERNALRELRGEQSRLIHRSSYWRPDVQPFDWRGAEYVCDRLHNSCKSCGLCACLDGAQPGWVNRDNVMPPELGVGAYWQPRPFQGGYLYELLEKEILAAAAAEAEERAARKAEETGQPAVVPNPASLFAGDYFDRVLGALVTDSVSAGGQRNPGGLAPAPVESALEALGAVGVYLNKGENDAAEDWNMHEGAEEVLGFAIWSLACHAVRTGRDPRWVVGLVGEATGGLDVWDDELRGVLMGNSAWINRFGPLG